MSDRRIAAAVDRWALAHRDELVRDLIGLISIRSVAASGEESAPLGAGCQSALDHMQTLAQGYGFAAENDGYCLSVLLPGSDARQELGILGHLDVVPEGAGWKYAPFSAIEKNGYVVGRGAMDNKGPVVMALHALRCMRELGIPLRSSVRLIAGADEEQGMRDVRHYLQTHKPPLFTLNCDGAWAASIGEKGVLTADLTVPFRSRCLSDMGGGESPNTVAASAWAELRGADPALLTQAQPGKWHWEENGDSLLLRTSGIAAHCAVPQNGQNAIRLLLRLLCTDGLLAQEETSRLKALLQAIRDDEGTGLGIHFADRVSGRTTCSGTQLSMDQETIRLHINVRFSITQQPEMLVRRLQERCAGLGLSVENLKVQPPRYDDPSAPEIKLLLNTCREFLDRRHPLHVTAGATHSRLFPRSIPFGPFASGRPAPNAFGGPHAADEAVCINDLLQAMKVYIVALIRLDRHFS